MSRLISNSPWRALSAGVAVGVMSMLNTGAEAAWYRYDALGRLVQASIPGKVITYVYDPAGNVLRRTVASDPDPDGDGLGNSIDPDDDGDGVDDVDDAFPLDASEQLDTDGDGIGNNADTDDDNDGLSDAAELALGRDPLLNEAGAFGTILPVIDLE